jgi:hypothetical protein
VDLRDLAVLDAGHRNLEAVIMSERSAPFQRRRGQMLLVAMLGDFETDWPGRFV